jgi:hypothetical protein
VGLFRRNEYSIGVGERVDVARLWLVGLFRRSQFRVARFQGCSVVAVRGPKGASTSSVWCLSCPWVRGGVNWRAAKAIACDHAVHCPARGGR